MSVNKRTVSNEITAARYMLVAAFVGLAFFMSYEFATARSASDASLTAGAAAAGGPGCGSAAGGPGCGSASSAPIEGSTTVEGGVQRISVDVSAGFNPNVIRAQAGIPTEITFSQGAGCMAQVLSRDLGFFQDLTTGAKTIAVPALQPGEYAFSCGMEMVSGTIVVE